MTVSVAVGALAGCSEAPSTTKPASQKPGECYIDAQNRTPKNIELIGWAFANTSESPQSITIKVLSSDQSTEFPAQLSDRPDIAKGFKSPALLKTGFSALIPVAKLPEGANISILTQSKSGEVSTCKTTFKAK